MGQYRRLFLIADAAMRHSAALRRAKALAEISGAELHIVAFVEDSVVFPALQKSAHLQIREQRLQEYRDWLADEAGLMRNIGIKVTTEVVWTNAALEEILTYTRDMQPDLLIKDVLHEVAFKRAFITPLDWHLLRESPVPVHLIGSLSQPLPRIVVAAIDAEAAEPPRVDINHRIILSANALALQCNADLHLAYSYDLSRALLMKTGAGSVILPTLIEEMQASHRGALGVLAEEYGVSADRYHFLSGPPANALAEFARKIQADVIVMGTAQRTGLRKLLGSTTEHLLQQLPCSVLAVKDSPRVEPLNPSE